MTRIVVFTYVLHAKHSFVIFKELAKAQYEKMNLPKFAIKTPEQ